MSLQNEIISNSIGRDTENVSNRVNTNSEILTEKIAFGIRGSDKKPRKFNPKSLQNLKQYQNTYLSNNSGMVYKSTGINITNIVLVIVAVLFLGFVIWKIIDRIKSSNYEKN